jgi:predicted TIM-barrel fold metal-dependent hydrolase
MRIDVHAHHYPREFFDYLNKSDGSHLKPLHGFGSAAFDERADLVKEAGVDVQVLSLGTAVRHIAESPAGVTAATIANDVLAEVTHGYGGRFAAFGCVGLPNVDAALREAARCLDELKMVGMALGCTIGNQSPEDPAFEPFWADMDQRAAVVFVHPTLRYDEALFSDYELTGSLGSTVEDSLVALRILLSGLTMRFPSVKIIVPHLGGGLAANYGRIQGRLKADMLRGLHYDTASCTSAALRCACEVMGVEQLVLGTDDYTGGKIAAGVEQVLQAGLSPHDTDAIMGDTAARLLGIATTTSPPAADARHQLSPQAH